MPSFPEISPPPSEPFPHLPIEDGQGFQIIAVLVKQSSSDKLPEYVKSLGELKKVEGVHIISEVRTVFFRKNGKKVNRYRSPGS